MLLKIKHEKNIFILKLRCYDKWLPSFIRINKHKRIKKMKILLKK